MAITDKFPSLEEVCKCVPESTGFDVEIKFPTPLEEQSYCVKVMFAMIGDPRFYAF